MNILRSNNHLWSDLKPNGRSLDGSTATKMTQKQYYGAIYSKFFLKKRKIKRTVDGEMIVFEKLGRGPLQAVQRRRSSHTQHPSSQCSKGYNAHSSAVYQSRRSDAGEGRDVGFSWETGRVEAKRWKGFEKRPLSWFVLKKYYISEFWSVWIIVLNTLIPYRITQLYLGYRVPPSRFKISYHFNL